VVRGGVTFTVIRHIFGTCVRTLLPSHPSFAGWLVAVSEVFHPEEERIGPVEEMIATKRWCYMACSSAKTGTGFQ
jgi:hypothetical protein